MLKRYNSEHTLHIQIYCLLNQHAAVVVIDGFAVSMRGQLV